MNFHQIEEMLPFDATVHSIEIYHPFFIETDIDIKLRKADGGELLDWKISPANDYLIGFARSLQKGKRYSFPQVFDDYLAQQTNKIGKIKKLN